MEKEQVFEKAVIYARYSSSGQRDESIEGQLRDCHEYAKKLGLNVIGEYCDYAISGTSDKRPQFQKMIKDSAKKQFTVVIVWKNDRFARSRYDSATYKFKLKQNGVRLIYAKEFIPDGPEGIILESVMEGYAEYYSANLSQNVKRGLYDSALKLQTLGQKCYGLRKGADGRFEHHPDQAPIVKRIFDEYTKGRPAKNIYQDLNSEGYRTVTGAKFSKNSLRGILKNEKYCGIYRYADIYVEDGIPAIIDKETFDKAQRYLAMHNQQPALKREEGGFLLTGKLFCGHCGEPMTAGGGTGKSGTRYNYYVCKNRVRKTCDKKRVDKDTIEDIVISNILKLIARDDVIEDFADQFMIWQSKDKTNVEAEILEKKLKEIEKSLDNVMKMIDSGIITPTLKKHLLELEQEKSDTEVGLAKAQIADPILTREEIIYGLCRFRDADTSDQYMRIHIIDTFVSAIYLYDDNRLVIIFNLTNKNNKISFDEIEEALADGVELCSNFAQCTLPNKKVA